MKLYGNSFFINQLKMCIANKNFFFDINLTNQIKPMLNLFLRLNFIRRYIHLTKIKIRVFPNWVSERSTLKKVRFFQKNPSPTLSLRSLTILNTHTFNSLLVLNTPYGLITHKEALRLKTGGFLICLIL